MSNLTDFIGGSGGGINPSNFTRIDITTSQTWVAPKATNNVFFIIVQGAGGSGAASATSSNSPVLNITSTGGMAGEFIALRKVITAGSSISITVGSGGSSVTTSSSNINGNAGGSTTFGNIVAKGGSGGVGVNGTAPLKLYSLLQKKYINVITEKSYYGGSNFESSRVIDNSVSKYNFYNLIDLSSAGIINYLISESNIALVTAGESSYLSDASTFVYRDVALAGGVGSGGGGAYSNAGNGTSKSCTSGAGGDGAVIIFYEQK